MLVSLQQEEVDIGHINKVCIELDGVEQDAMDSMIKLSERYNSQNDSKSCAKVSKEMEQMKIEYTSAQNRVQQMIKILNPAYQPEDKGSGVQVKSDSYSRPTVTNSDRELLSAEYSLPNMRNYQSDVLSETDLIGQDLWKQLKRVSIPTFSVDKRTYQNWKAALMACIDRALATPEYKLLQRLAGEALKTIESLGYLAAVYEAAKK